MEGYRTLTLDDLANYYDRVVSGRPARTIEIDAAIDWALRREEFTSDEEGLILIKTEAYNNILEKL